MKPVQKTLALGLLLLGSTAANATTWLFEDLAVVGGEVFNHLAV